MAFVWYHKTKEILKSRIPYTVTQGDFNNIVVTTGELLAEKFVRITAPGEDLKSLGIFEITVAKLLPEGTMIDSGMVVAEIDQSKILEKLTEAEKSLSNAQNEFRSIKLDTSADLSSLRDQIINHGYTIEELKTTLEQSKYESPAVIKQAENSLDKAKRELAQALKNYAFKKQKAIATVFQKSMDVQRFLTMCDKLNSILKNLVIRSQTHGMLVYFRGQNGKLIEAGSTFQLWADPIIATIPDFGSMISNTYINEVDISKVKRGQLVKVGIDAFPDKTYDGKVVYIANIGEQLPNSDAKVFNVKIKINHPDSILRPGMTTSNQIISSSIKNVVFIPLDALQKVKEVSYVYKNNGLFATKQPVVTGDYNDNYIIIKKGLKPDDVIYLSAPDEKEMQDNFEKKDSL
jgi:multidrug resistance efflux pump